jgi:hypothetical protein
MPYPLPLGEFKLLAGSNPSCVITSASQLDSSTITTPSTPSTSSSTHDSTTTTKAVAIAIPILVVAIIIAVVGLIVLRRRKKQAVPDGEEYVPDAQYGIGKLPPNLPTATESSGMDYYSPTLTPFVVTSAMESLSQMSLPSPKPRPLYDTPPRRSGRLSPPPVPDSPPPASVISSVSPPAYQTFVSPDGSRIVHTLHVVSALEEDTQDYDDEIGRYSATHRDVIPRDLEEKLRRARYLPTDDPNEIPADIWLNEYGVRYFELKRLRELYQT